ncbi:hypothetical protein KCV87_32260 [Actinosynnema pretiosum subsp. pretiosum]|uniref:Uncharacterized protein n=1 Tax=Actinosynnema pretiosum subsp. pretiosum TaxID=103721 RepID=A0AA45R3L4_9PSEU|nr:hypothetical protein APASM_4687 [Actinosynnema pretiosum subsp. pretiosum]QUF03977.1 hypothetical protein KCV87_32260 [Actinosynnema pretiosum subsp. pretiosum]
MTWCAIAGCESPEPVPGDWLVCDRCHDRLHSGLRWIEFYLAHLTPVRGVRPQLVATSSGFGSASPADDAVLVMLDPRSAATGVGRSLTGPDDDEHPLLSAPAVLGGWARQVYDQRTPPSLRALIPAPRTVRDAVSTLLASLGWICAQPWAPDFAAELHQLRGQLAAATGEAPPPVVATCTEPRDDLAAPVDGRAVCGGGIVVCEREEPRTGLVMPVAARCLLCHRVYSAFELIDLAQDGDMP